MALGKKRNGSVFATAAQRRDMAEYQVTSEPEVVPVVVDDTPQRTLNTDIGALGRAHNLFFTPSAEGRDFNSVLQEVQEYISGAYAALITYGSLDQTLSSDAVCLLGSLSQALLTEQLDSLVEVAVGLGQCLLAVHHAYAGHFAELLYVSSGKSHFIIPPIYDFTMKKT